MCSPSWELPSALQKKGERKTSQLNNISEHESTIPARGQGKDLLEQKDTASCSKPFDVAAVLLEGELMAVSCPSPSLQGQ